MYVFVVVVAEGNTVVAIVVVLCDSNRVMSPTSLVVAERIDDMFILLDPTAIETEHDASNVVASGDVVVVIVVAICDSDRVTSFTLLDLVVQQAIEAADPGGLELLL